MPVPNKEHQNYLSIFHDKMLIEALYKQKFDKFSQVLDLAFNLPLVLLKLLNEFPYAQVHEKRMDDLNLNNVLAWKKCRKYLRKKH